jgi:hypothetical protein
MGGNAEAGFEVDLPDFLVPPGNEVVVDFERCFRLTEAAPLRDQLLGLLDRLSDFSGEFGGDVCVDVEPNGDACNSGIGVTLSVLGDVWIAELNPIQWLKDPSQFQLMFDRLDASGWTFTRPFHDLAPTAPVQWPAAGEEYPFGEEVHAPIPRLVVDRRDDSRDWFIDEVIRAATTCLGAKSSMWFLAFTSVDAANSEQLVVAANRLGHTSDYWHIDLSKLLPLEWVTTAVWPAGSEAAHLLCAAGAHHLHEPPCINGQVIDHLGDQFCSSTQRKLRLPGSSPTEHLTDEVRLTSVAPLSSQLLALLEALSELSLDLSVDIEFLASPTGRLQEDLCFVQFGVYGNTWVVEISPIPRSSDGELTVELMEVLSTNGWLIDHEPVEPSPLAKMNKSGIGYQQDDISCPRLVCNRIEDSPAEFVQTVIQDSALVMAAPIERWFLGDACADGRRSVRLRGLAAVWGRDSQMWNVDLRRVLPESWTEDAIYPAGSPRAVHACIEGLHHLHEPPCENEIVNDDWGFGHGDEP